MKNLNKALIWLVIAVLLSTIWIFVVGVYSNQPGSYYNKGHNAVWIEHKWVGERSTYQEIQKLVYTLTENDIDTVFVHSGPLNPDGGVYPQTYMYAPYFLEAARRFNPEIKYQAWLGQVRGKIDLEEPPVRQNIAQQCSTLTQYVGFDGIHFDIEPVWDGDVDFIKVLEDCRNKVPSDKQLSVALAEFIPRSLIWFTENILEFNNYNTEVNYRNVAKYADQIVVMTYDTSINHSWLYKWLVQEQTIRTTHVVDDTEIFIGIPAYQYEDDTAWFNPEVENVENGIKGILKGLNNLRSNEDNFAGVAIYPYWEIDENEWKMYKELWLK